MAFAEPLFSQDLVDLAGEALNADLASEAFLNALGLNYLDVINNRRAAHAYPLNTFQATLRQRTAKVDPSFVVAQRIKRLSSIRGKLERYDWLTLSQMQDIAGCRAIVSSVDQVYELAETYRQKYAAHELDAVNDYIRNPKSDGYRSYHLIYRYCNNNSPIYDGLKIEMQFRSVLQHCWATAVEIADIFYREGLKAHRGSPDWSRFFALMGAAIAKREGCRRVPRTPSDSTELIEELRHYAMRLDVSNRLDALGRTLNIIGETDARGHGIKYVLLVLDPHAGNEQLRLFGFRAKDLDAATKEYERSEEFKSEGSDAVLVSVSDAASLRRAYPNYFLDTSVFLQTLDDLIS